MGRVLPVLIVIAVTIFTLVTVVQSEQLRVRHLPRWVWFLIVLLIPVAGLGAWWIFGRPLPTVRDEPRPVAPDDDPDFLRGL